MNDRRTALNVTTIQSYNKATDMLYSYFDRTKENEYRILQQITSLQVENENLWLQLRKLQEYERINRQIVARRPCDLGST